jgi:hypothetical protein
MFVHMKKLPAKTADAIDLLIEFSTLGEYGLEYPERPVDRRNETCRSGRVRPAAALTARPGSPTRSAGPGENRIRRDKCPVRATSLPEALMPPRIRLDPQV